MAKQIIEQTRQAIPATTVDVAPNRTNANTGLVVRNNGIDTAPPQPVDFRNVAQLCSAAGHRIAGILLDYNGAGSVTIGTRGRFRVKIVTATTPAATHIGDTIIPTTTEGEANIHATSGVGEIVDFDGAYVYVDLSLPN